MLGYTYLRYLRQFAGIIWFNSLMKLLSMLAISWDFAFTRLASLGPVRTVTPLISEAIPWAGYKNNRNLRRLRALNGISRTRSW